MVGDRPGSQGLYDLGAVSYGRILSFSTLRTRVPPPLFSIIFKFL